MADHRRPAIVILLRFSGKKKSSKVELFDRKLFTDKPLPRRCTAPQYRIRVGGKWFPKGAVNFYALWEVRDLFWNGVVEKMKK